MGWVRLDDRITEHPKIAAAGPFGFAVFVAGIAYCNRNLTDGFIPRSVAATLLSAEWIDSEGTIWTAAQHSGHRGEDIECLQVVEHLVDIGLFYRVDCHAVTNTAGYAIHDYEDYQPSRSDVIEKREKDLERQKKWREGKEKTAKVQGKTPRKRHAVTNAVNNATVTSDPTPTPTVTTEPNGSVAVSRVEHAGDVLAAVSEAFTAKGIPISARHRGILGKQARELIDSGFDFDAVVLACVISLKRGEPQNAHFIAADLVTAKAGERITRREYEKALQDEMEVGRGSA